MARPQIKIDEKKVLRLASIGATMEMIAAACDCSVDTLERRFADVVKRGREKAKGNLLGLLWGAAEGGNVVAMIWLSKQQQYLGFREPRDITNSEEIDKVINMVFKVGEGVAKKLSGGDSGKAESTVAGAEGKDTL